MTDNLSVDSWRWRDRALCAGMDTDLFRIANGPQKVAAAKKICSGCPVRQVCLEDAIALESLGFIRGGEDPTDHHPAHRAARELARARSRRQRDKLKSTKRH